MKTVLSKLLLGVVLLCTIFYNRNARSAELVKIWDPSLREDILVDLCLSTFPAEWDDDELIQVVKASIDLWNTNTGGADFYLDYNGELSVATEANGCIRDSEPPAGHITIKFENCRNLDCSYSTVLATGFAWEQANGYVNKGTLTIYRGPDDNEENFIGWEFYYPDADLDNNKYSLLLNLNHELGHAIGVDHDNSSTEASIMDPTYRPTQRTIWSRDADGITDTSKSKHYNRVTDRYIERTKSTDSGMSWSNLGQLSDSTNTKIGLSYNASANSSSRYMIAWRGDNASHWLNTMTGSASSFDATSKVTHAYSSDYGPALAYGDGIYLMVWTDDVNARTIQYRKLPDGGSWSSVATLSYVDAIGDPAQTYGSLAEPAVAWNSTAEAFVVIWTNWTPTGDSDDLATLGRINACVLYPDDSGFTKCEEFGYVANSAPSIDCSPSANECLIAYSSADPALDYQMRYRKATVTTSGGLDFTGSTYITSYAAAKAGFDVEYGDALYVGYRGDDGANYGNSIKSTTYPYWGTKTYTDPYLQTTPSLEYGTNESELLYFYTNH